MTDVVTVVGEALVDLVPTEAAATFRAAPGGSPFNVAVGLARLSTPTALLARISDTAFGRVLREHARSEGIDVSAAPAASQQTTLAVVSVGAVGTVDYDFYTEGTADWHWTEPELAALPTGTAVLHLGSLASWTPPGAALLNQLAARTRASGEVLVSYDPNVRPRLLGEPDAGRRAVEATLCSAHLVKASQEDVDWLYPGSSVAQVATRWLGLGVLVVVVTDGPHGATAFRHGAPAVSVPGRPVQVVDTVGAGDSFMSALLAGLVRRDRHRPAQVADLSDDVVADLLSEAVLVSSLTCTRPGADPPVLQPDRVSTAAERPLGPDDLGVRDPA